MFRVSDPEKTVRCVKVGRSTRDAKRAIACPLRTSTQPKALLGHRGLASPRRAYAPAGPTIPPDRQGVRPCQDVIMPVRAITVTPPDDAGYCYPIA